MNEKSKRDEPQSQKKNINKKQEFNIDDILTKILESRK